MKSIEIIFSHIEIKTAAAEFLQLVNKFKVFAFSGDLGAGKTTFITELCHQMNVLEDVTSPTYSIIQQYHTANDQTVYHLDLYRLRDMDEAIDAGVEDTISSGEICFVEWPEKVPELYPAETVYVSIGILENYNRKMIIKLPS